jgi:hypothetical protein
MILITVSRKKIKIKNNFTKKIKLSVILKKKMY